MAKTKAATASIDMSDGLTGSLQLIGELGNCKLDIDYYKVHDSVDDLVLPIAEKLKVDKIKFAFSPGYDWETLLTIKADRFREVRNEVKKAGGDLLEIGVVKEGSGVFMKKDEVELPLRNSISGEKFKGYIWCDKAKSWLETECFG